MIANIEFNGKILASVELPDYAKTASPDELTELVKRELFKDVYQEPFEIVDFGKEWDENGIVDLNKFIDSGKEVF